MITNCLTLCDSNIPWHHNRYSKHHLMARLARHNDVVFVNPQVDALAYGRTKGWGRVASVRGRLEQPEGEALNVFTPLALPWKARSERFIAADQRYLCRQFKSIVRRYPGRELVLFIGNPYNVFLLDAFPECKCSIYHCSDNFPALFQGATRQTVQRREAELIKRADVVLCSHESLLRKCQDLGGNARYLGHAVDERLLRPLDRPVPDCPAELAAIPSPRVGFVGSLDGGIDYGLLREVGKRCSKVSFVFIGQTGEGQQANVQGLTEAPNMHWLGPKPWSELPGLLWNLDVAIIPYAVDGFTTARSPLKLFEYLAAGLPVVSTTAPPEEDFAPYVTVVRGAEEFAGALQAAVHGKTDGLAQVALMRARYTWDRRAEEMAQIIEDGLERTSRA